MHSSLEEYDAHLQAEWSAQTTVLPRDLEGEWFGPSSLRTNPGTPGAISRRAAEEAPTSAFDAPSSREGAGGGGGAGGPGSPSGGGPPQPTPRLSEAAVQAIRRTYNNLAQELRTLPTTGDENLNLGPFPTVNELRQGPGRIVPLEQAIEAIANVQEVIDVGYARRPIMTSTGPQRLTSADNIALLFSELHRDALLLQAEHRDLFVSASAGQGLLQPHFLTLALMRRLRRSGQHISFVPRDDPNFGSFVRAVRQGAPIDMPFSEGGGGHGEGVHYRGNPLHGQNAHAFQLAFVQPEIERAGVSVADFRDWLMSTRERRRVWNFLFDPLNRALMRPELLTPAIRNALVGAGAVRGIWP